MVGPLLFQRSSYYRYKMNEIANSSLLVVMPEMHLRQPRFTYSAFWPFTKNKERIQV